MVLCNKLSERAAFGLGARYMCVSCSMYMYTVNVREYDLGVYMSTFGKLLSFWAENPNGRGIDLTLEIYPMQVTQAIPNDATAYT